MTDAYDRFCAWDEHHNDDDLYPPRAAFTPPVTPKLAAIPPITCDADPNPPATALFGKRPAAELQPGDYVLVDEGMYRVAGKRALRQSLLFNIVLHPVQGGRITSMNFYPRNWLPAFKAAQGD